MLTRRSLTPILGLGGLIAAATLAAFVLGSLWADDELANRLAFATLVGSQLSSSIVFRNELAPFFQLRRNSWLLGAIAASALALVAVFYVPALREAFGVSPLSAAQWLAVAGLSAIPFVAGEAAKSSGLIARLHLDPEEMEPRVV